MGFEVRNRGFGNEGSLDRRAGVGFFGGRRL